MCFYGYNYGRENNIRANIGCNIKMCRLLRSDRSYWLSLSIAKVSTRRSLTSHLLCGNNQGAIKAIAVVMR